MGAHRLGLDGGAEVEGEGEGVVPASTGARVSPGGVKAEGEGEGVVPAGTGARVSPGGGGGHGGEARRSA